MKFSVSPNKNGFIRASEIRAHKIITKPNKSLKEKKGWKGILS